MNLGIVIPHYGAQKDLDKCLNSLHLPLKTDLGFIEVYVHDNNKVNIGFTAGNNKGITHFLRETGVKSIWLLNNDTSVENPGLILKASGEDFQDPLIGILGFKILSMSDPDFIHHGGTGEPYPAGRHKTGQVSQNDLEVSTYEHWVTGASWIIRREVFETIGLLDETFVNYYSDSDFCFRARAAGFKVLYDPRLVIQHKIGQSAQPDSEQTKVLKMDMLKFQDAWMSGKRYFDLNHEFLK